MLRGSNRTTKIGPKRLLERVVVVHHHTKYQVKRLSASACSLTGMSECLLIDSLVMSVTITDWGMNLITLTIHENNKGTSK